MSTQKTPPPSLSREQEVRLRWLGGLAAIGFAFGAGLLLPRLFEVLESTLPAPITQLGWTVFFGIPILMGALAAWIWRPLKMKRGDLGLGALAITAGGICTAGWLLREGIVCLAMAAPLLWLMIYLGCLLGDWLARMDERGKHLYVSALPLMLLLLWHDATSASGVGVVRDEITIRATPQQVWKYLPTFAPVSEYSPYWLYNLGVPRPVRSITFGEGVGARRECRLTQNIVVGERVTVWQPARVLEFEITEQPKHPEFTGHCELLKGRLEIVENGNGTITLIGTSWYRLQVQPSAYFGLWTDDVIRHVHLDVMNHIKTLAERDAGKA